MKAVIMEIERGYAVALTENREFIKIKDNGRLKIGYEVDVPCGAGIKTGTWTRIASVAAAFLMVIGVGAGVYSYSASYVYVNMDINPSIELTANVFDRIIGARGLNEDGEKLLSLGKYSNRPLDEGIQDILKSAVDEGYINNESEANTVVIAVSARNPKKAVQISDTVENTAKAKLEEAKVQTEIIVEKATLQKVEDAKKHGISPGKLVLIEKLIEADPELKEENVESIVEDKKEASVKEIMKSIKQARKEEKSAAKQEDNKPQSGKANTDRRGNDDDKGPNSSKSNGSSVKPKDKLANVWDTIRKRLGGHEEEKNETRDRDGKENKEDKKAADKPNDKKNWNPRRQGEDDKNRQDDESRKNNGYKGNKEDRKKREDPEDKRDREKRNSLPQNRGKVQRGKTLKR